MWKMLRDKYGVLCKRCVYITLVLLLAYMPPTCDRDTVMLLMKELDPHGVDLRRSRKLCRRVYYNKVVIYQQLICFTCIYHFRALILCGMLTVMINCQLSTYAYMVALMGSLLYIHVYILC